MCVYEGLKMTIIKGFRTVELRVDSESVVRSISGGEEGSSSNWSLVHQIQRILHEDW